MQRRLILKLIGMVMLAPLNALAAVWNKSAFEATSTQAALKGLTVSEATLSNDIVIIAPDFAENGSVVQVEVKSNIPNSEAIAILVDKNPTSLIANFMFGQGALAHVITRIKMAETSEVHAIVKVGKQYFKATKRVEVSLSGCG